MPSIVYDCKRIQRVMAIVIRAAERCLPTAQISNILVEYYNDDFKMEFTVTFADYDNLSADAEHSDSKKCAGDFLKQLKDESTQLLKEYKKGEKEYKADLKKYDQAFCDSQAVKISAMEMFLTILKSIKP